MKWIIYIGLGHKPASVHDSLDEAMEEVCKTWVRPNPKRFNLGWWFHPQMDDRGTMEYVAVELPVEEEARKRADFPSGYIPALAIAREDRAWSNLCESNSEGNEVQAEADWLTSHGVGGRPQNLEGTNQ